MLLISFEVCEFKSVLASNQVEVGEITCLVGKNEAGKTAVLQALYRLNPIIPADGKFDLTDDYPRMEVEDYRQDVETNRRQPAIPIRATYELEDDERTAIATALGVDCFKGKTFSLSREYGGNTRTLDLAADLGTAIAHLQGAADITDTLKESLRAAGPDIDALVVQLNGAEKTEAVIGLLDKYNKIKQRGISGYIYDTYLMSREPKYMYFDEYYQMRGHENIEKLIQRQTANQLRPSDHPMIGLIALSRLNLAELLNPNRTQDLKNKLEGAGNFPTRQILKYWSQNRHLQMRFDVRPARPGDPEEMRDGTNIWGEVYDTRHFVSTELGSRSRGFVWFFSFLAWYSEVKRRNEPIILLLDEPGLTLHGRAQADLLRYFEEELKTVHQVIYTTHSPFMVDPRHFDRVRIVQDLSIDAVTDLPRGEQGTKVLADALGATSDSLFPLQGALGYEVQQTLFVGPNSLIVEGVSDLLFLQIMSSLLAGEGRAQLDPRWTITPVGGSSKLPAFVGLLGAQSGMNVATLIDIQPRDRAMVEDLYKKLLLEKRKVLTFGHFTGKAEADIEDMFDEAFYLNLVNGAYIGKIARPVTASDLNAQLPRVTRRLDEFFKTNPLTQGKFIHFEPARYLMTNIDLLKRSILATVKDRFEEAFKALNALL